MLLCFKCYGDFQKKEIWNIKIMYRTIKIMYKIKKTKKVKLLIILVMMLIFKF